MLDLLLIAMVFASINITIVIVIIIAIPHHGQHFHPLGVRLEEGEAPSRPTG